jgi:hypothetical protein
LFDQLGEQASGKATSSSERVKSQTALQGIVDKPLWNQEAATQASGKTAAHERSAAQGSAAVPVAGAAGGLGQVASGSKAPPALPAFDIPPSDISGMANRILNAHGATAGNASSTQPQASILPNGTPYVDAMGNPLGPTRELRELPNIKDEPAPTSTPTSQNKQASAGATIQAQVAQATSPLVAFESQVQTLASRPSESAREVAMESEVAVPNAAPASMSGVVHERAAPHSARSPLAGAIMGGVMAPTENAAGPGPEAPSQSPTLPAVTAPTSGVPPPMPESSSRPMEATSVHLLISVRRGLAARIPQLQKADCRYAEGGNRKRRLSDLDGSVRFPKQPPLLVPPQRQTNQRWRLSILRRSSKRSWKNVWTQSDGAENL